MIEKIAGHDSPIRATLRRAWNAVYFRVLTSTPAVAWQRKSALPDTATWRWETEPLRTAEKICIFVTYALAGVVPERAWHHAALWHDAGYTLLFVVALDDFSLHPEIRFGHAICRENLGHDFAAWSRAICEIDLGGVAMLATANDSVFASDTLGAAIERAENLPADVVGFTENTEYRWHIQSYAILFKAKAIRTKAFSKFWTPRIGSRQHVIRTYEAVLAKTMAASGCEIAVLFPVNKKGNPTNLHWLDLARSGFPYLKRSHLLKQFKDWEGHLEERGFDELEIRSEYAALSQNGR